MGAEDRLGNYLDQHEKYLADNPEARLYAAMNARGETAKPDDRTAASRLYEEYVAKPLSAVVGSLLTGGASPATELANINKHRARDPQAGADEATARAKAAHVIGDVVVPQNLTELGMQVGTGGAAKYVKTGRRLADATARVAAAATGAGAGAAVEGKNVATEAGKAGGITGAVEVAVPVAGKIMRSAPGAKGRIAAKDAREFGEWIDQHTDMGRPLTVDDLMEMASGPGLAKSGAAKEARVEVIERLLDNRPISVPTVSDAPMSLRDANRALSEIGDMLRGVKPLDPRFKDADLKQLYGRVADEIRSGIAATEGQLARESAFGASAYGPRATRPALPAVGESTDAAVAGGRFEVSPRGVGGGTGKKSTKVVREITNDEPVGQMLRAPDTSGGALALRTDAANEPSIAAALWDLTQQRSRAGYRVQDWIKDPQLYRRYADEVQFNTPELQKWMGNPEGRAELRKALGESAFNDLVARINRGGRIGLVDELAFGQGRAADALRMAEEQKGSFGLWRPVVSAYRALLPNSASRYAGRAPYSVGPGAQTALDLLVQELVTGGAGR